MLPDWVTGTWLLALDWAIRLAALLWIPARTTPGAARSWLLLIGFVPVVGLPLYLLFGHPWLSRLRVERQATASQVIREQQLPLHALRWTPQADTSSAEVVPLIEREGDFMPTLGNAVELLDDYAHSLQTLIAAIDAAEKRVHLLYYLMFDDAVGEAVVAALERASARGVRCRVLLDAVGAKRGLRRYSKRLQDGGVQVLAVLPGGLPWRRSGRMDLRNHRKIAVIDNQMAFVGSQNLAEAGFIDGVPNRGWWHACAGRWSIILKRCSPATGSPKPASAWTSGRTRRCARPISPRNCCPAGRRIRSTMRAMRSMR